jgi:hypothetical protein
MGGGWRRGVAEEDDARMTGRCLDWSYDLGERRKDKDTKDTQNAPETVSFIALN